MAPFIVQFFAGPDEEVSAEFIEHSLILEQINDTDFVGGLVHAEIIPVINMYDRIDPAILNITDLNINNSVMNYLDGLHVSDVLRILVGCEKLENAFGVDVVKMFYSQFSDAIKAENHSVYLTMMGWAVVFDDL